MTTVYLWIGAALALFAGGAYIGHDYTAAKAKVAMQTHLAADRKAEADAVDRVRKAEKATADALAKISDSYEKGKKDAQSDYEKTVADLHTGTLRLQSRWATCETGRVSNAAAAARELDAITRDREESAARVVLAAATCDRQVKGLQDLLTKLGAK